MKIFGLQKMTLLDFPGHVACTVFTGGCNYRCPFCHNFELADGTAPPLMDEAELLAFLKKRTGLLDGVAITGGEPCLNPGLPELLRQIRAMGFAVKLDTNGCYPDMLEALLAEGLVDYAAMDVKNSPENYARTAGLDAIDLAPVERSMKLLKSGGIEYELRTTVVKELHSESDFRAIGPWIEGAPRYFLQCFTDRDTVPFAGLSAPSVEELKTYAEIVRPYVGSVELRGV